MKKNGKARKRSNLVIGMVQLLVFAAPVTAQISCGGYEVTAIIHPPECPPFGIPPTVGTAISEPIDGGLPNVVGYYQSCAIGPDTAFLWIGNKDEFITIPMPARTIASAAYDIEGTQIVGAFDLGGDGLGGLGFVYDSQADDFINLGTFPQGNYSVARAVNTKMQVTGYWGNFVNGDPSALVFFWADGVMNDVGPPIGGVANRAFGINEAAAITGWRREADGDEQIAFLWNDGRITDLGPIPRGFTSQGEGINIHNQITGWGKLPDPEGGGTVSHPFFWSDGRMIDLGTLPGFPLGWGRDINDAATIVGGCGGAGQTGFIWQDGVMTALNDLVPPELRLDIQVASAINSAGQIIAYGEDSKSDVVSFLLTPIEPPAGDLDGDCTVGASDLLILLADWGPCKGCPSDLDGNGMVGASDLLILLENWG